MTPAGRERFAHLSVPVGVDISCDVVLRAIIETEGRLKRNPGLRAQYAARFRNTGCIYSPGKKKKSTTPTPT